MRLCVLISLTIQRLAVTMRILMTHISRIRRHLTWTPDRRLLATLSLLRPRTVTLLGVHSCTYMSI